MEILPALRMGVQGPLHQDKSINMQQLQVTIIIQTKFIHISVLNCIFLFSKIVGISFYIAAWGMKNMNKINFLSLTESKKQFLEKKHINKII